jgi:hypothetical protein
LRYCCLNSILCAFKAGALPLEPCLQPIRANRRGGVEGDSDNGKGRDVELQ